MLVMCMGPSKLLINAMFGPVVDYEINVARCGTFIVFVTEDAN